MAKAKKKAAKKAPARRAQKETKDEKTEVSNMSLLTGNMPPIKDILYHAEQIAGYQAKAKTASMNVTKAKKAAKDAGVDLRVIAEGRGLIGAEPLDVATYFRQLAVFMREKGCPVQIQLFEPKYGSPEEQGKKEGWDAGKAARNPDLVRWPEGAPGHREYMRSWNDAQAENASGIKKSAHPDDAND